MFKVLVKNLQKAGAELAEKSKKKAIELAKEAQIQGAKKAAELAKQAQIYAAETSKKILNQAKIQASEIAKQTNKKVETLMNSSAEEEKQIVSFGYKRSRKHLSIKLIDREIKYLRSL